MPTTTDKPYGKSYTVEMLGNVVGNGSVRYLNDYGSLKELAIAQMKAGETVWFGSDVGPSQQQKRESWQPCLRLWSG